MSNFTHAYNHVGVVCMYEKYRFDSSHKHIRTLIHTRTHMKPQHTVLMNSFDGLKYEMKITKKTVVNFIEKSKAELIQSKNHFCFYFCFIRVIYLLYRINITIFLRCEVGHTYHFIIYTKLKHR